MTNPNWLPETTLPDAKGNPTIVRKGDKVDLKDIGSIVDDEEKYFAEKDRDFHLNWLGKGPYEISNIGQWPCGRVMIYVKTETSSGAGVYASDLAYCGNNSQAKEVELR